MIGTTFTIEDNQGQQVKINDHSDPEKVIALQSYPQFRAGVKNNEVNRQGQHGVWDFNSYYNRMMITFQGVIVGRNEQEVEELKSKLNRVVSLPIQPQGDNDGLVTIKWTDPKGNDWQVEAKLFNDINFSRRLKQTYRLDFNMSLKAPDPFIVSQELLKETGTRADTGTGTTFPIKLATSLGSVTLNKLIIDNQGNVDAHTNIRLYGEDEGTITNPRVINTTTGEEFKLTMTLNGANEYVEINSKDGTVVDQEGNDVSGNITSDSNFITLLSGTNELAYFADEEDRVPTAQWFVEYRNTTV